jgi:peptide/nickel transport system ATP-binding protein
LVPVLQVEHLKKEFSVDAGRTLLAVDDVSFSVAAGEKVAIIGESGSGKTTVVRMIARLTAVTDGRILLQGEDITHMTGRKMREYYRHMQLVFQTPADSFDPRRTLGDGIAEGLRNFGWQKQAAWQEMERLLMLCGLEAEIAQRYPHEVSGGQCQRAAIARALALRPKLLLLDEATSALDVTVQADILALLNQLQRELSLAYLFICHDIALVQDFCDRVLVMHEGRIIEEGTPDAVIGSPKQAYTQRLIDSVL